MKQGRINGKINVGCLFIIIVLLIGGYLGFKFGSVYLAKYILNRKIFTIAGDAAQDYKGRIFPNNRAIADAIIEEAEKLRVDIPLDNIQIAREKNFVVINVLWEGDIVLPKYTHHFAFEFNAKRRVDN